MELQKAPISHTAESARADDHGDVVLARHVRPMAQPAADLGRNCWGWLREHFRELVLGRTRPRPVDCLWPGRALARDSLRTPARDVATLHDMELAVCPGPFSVLCRAERFRRAVRLCVFPEDRVIVHWTCNRMEQVIF